MLNRTKREAAWDTGYTTVLFVMKCHRTLTCDANYFICLFSCWLCWFLVWCMGCRRHMQAFSGGSERGILFIAVLGFVTAMCHWLRNVVSRLHRLSSCGTWIKYSPMTCGIVVSRAGMEPVSPVWAGRSVTAGPPGKSLNILF